MRIHTGDTVIVISGKDKGKTGTVLRVLTGKDRVVVRGINLLTKHLKKRLDRPGERIRFEGAIHRSNVMLLDPKTKKRTRIGYVRETKGKKRVARKSGTVLGGKIQTAS